LLQAATELLAEGGVKAVTHRAVAARARVPLAATTYYFESIQQLTEAALSRHVGERVEELTQITARAGVGGRTTEQIALRFADALVGRERDVIVAQYEVYLEAARTPALRPAVAAALDAFEDLARASLAVLGAKRPDPAAKAFIALLDGFQLHRMARPRPAAEDAAELFESMRALFIAFAMDEAELQRWHDHFRADLVVPEPT
jgi:DNA-binding transcriptional regulator YbjK